MADQFHTSVSPEGAGGHLKQYRRELSGFTNSAGTSPKSRERTSYTIKLQESNIANDQFNPFSANRILLPERSLSSEPVQINNRYTDSQEEQRYIDHGKSMPLPPRLNLGVSMGAQGYKRSHGELENVEAGYTYRRMKGGEASNSSTGLAMPRNNFEGDSKGPRPQSRQRSQQYLQDQEREVQTKQQRPQHSLKQNDDDAKAQQQRQQHTFRAYTPATRPIGVVPTSACPSKGSEGKSEIDHGQAQYQFQYQWKVDGETKKGSIRAPRGGPKTGKSYQKALGQSSGADAARVPGADRLRLDSTEGPMIDHTAALSQADTLQQEVNRLGGDDGEAVGILSPGMAREQKRVGMLTKYIEDVQCEEGTAEVASTSGNGIMGVTSKVYQATLDEKVQNLMQAYLNTLQLTQISLDLPEEDSFSASDIEVSILDTAGRSFVCTANMIDSQRPQSEQADNDGMDADAAHNSSDIPPLPVNPTDLDKEVNITIPAAISGPAIDSGNEQSKSHEISGVDGKSLSKEKTEPETTEEQVANETQPSTKTRDGQGYFTDTDSDERADLSLDDGSSESASSTNMQVTRRKDPSSDPALSDNKRLKEGSKAAGRGGKNNSGVYSRKSSAQVTTVPNSQSESEDPPISPFSRRTVSKRNRSVSPPPSVPLDHFEKPFKRTHTPADMQVRGVGGSLNVKKAPVYGRSKSTEPLGAEKRLNGATSRGLSVENASSTTTGEPVRTSAAAAAESGVSAPTASADVAETLQGASKNNGVDAKNLESTVETSEGQKIENELYGTSNEPGIVNTKSTEARIPSDELHAIAKASKVKMKSTDADVASLAAVAKDTNDTETFSNRKHDSVNTSVNNDGRNSDRINNSKEGLNKIANADNFSSTNISGENSERLGMEKENSAERVIDATEKVTTLIPVETSRSKDLTVKLRLPSKTKTQSTVGGKSDTTNTNAEDIAQQHNGSSRGKRTAAELDIIHTLEANSDGSEDETGGTVAENEPSNQAIRFKVVMSAPRPSVTDARDRTREFLSARSKSVLDDLSNQSMTDTIAAADIKRSTSAFGVRSDHSDRYGDSVRQSKKMKRKPSANELKVGDARMNPSIDRALGSIVSGIDDVTASVAALNASAESKLGREQTPDVAGDAMPALTRIISPRGSFSGNRRHSLIVLPSEDMPAAVPLDAELPLSGTNSRSNSRLGDNKSSDEELRKRGSRHNSAQPINRASSLPRIVNGVDVKDCNRLGRRGSQIRSCSPSREGVACEDEQLLGSQDMHATLERKESRNSVNIKAGHSPAYFPTPVAISTLVPVYELVIEASGEHTIKENGKTDTPR
ncbi:hypothetical protein SARC_02003 [Sphaeroforma arctica JP610]|uniref:Uncharacterized protein n=1 Tax=Sphaeroforma arctica JP610 TaxID=667725 RepID=A0A0L0GA85_9EUKA|nr:hypothetical protein SARC_02003 [Sphaeroforma arctica JP610]KNC85819.1 hypothetical protein SARC_02003 [Sphaeroforma arctica JP610]|eukprot:XP_014159721.1 hypothetical protein SARC_02003 [Sphaeroforma arctica JP610]